MASEHDNEPESKKHSRIFISHATANTPLAKAWCELMSKISAGAEWPWYSSDPHAKKGVLVGEDWRQKILNALDAAEVVIVILTPESNERTWPSWETGVATGGKKRVVPVYLFMEKDRVHDVFLRLQASDGLDQNNVLGLCDEILFPDWEVPPQTRESWKTFFDEYTAQVEEHRQESFTRSLFMSSFHNEEIARGLEGIWEARWYTDGEEEGDSEELFEHDALQVWTTATRIRLVGRSTKRGVDEVVKIDPDAAHYPMEGVVSSGGWIALSYWSGGRIPICGTTLLRRADVSWHKLEGTWEGYTSQDFEDPDIRHTRGRVEMRYVAEDWVEWDEMQEAQAADGQD